MTPEQFVYWLQGFMEVAEPTQLGPKETQQIKNHLNLVFNKKTPEVKEDSQKPLFHYDQNSIIPPDPFDFSKKFCSPTSTIGDPNLIYSNQESIYSFTPSNNKEGEKH